MEVITSVLDHNTEIYLNIAQQCNKSQISNSNFYKIGRGSLRKKCPNAEFFLVRIFPYMDTFHVVDPLEKEN